MLNPQLLSEKCPLKSSMTWTEIQSWEKELLQLLENVRKRIQVKALLSDYSDSKSVKRGTHLAYFKHIFAAGNLNCGITEI